MIGCGIKKIRGPTVCSKIWSLPATQRIHVSFNKHEQPDGPNVSNCTNFLGTIARNGRMAPLTYIDWKALPKPCKDDMWIAIREKFDVNHGNKDWVFKSIGKKWKDWKFELKHNRYKIHNTNEERLKDLDIRVVPKQWSILVSYWNSLEGKEQCKTGKDNRALQRLNHTAGSKSFAQICREKVDWQEVRWGGAIQN
ncbi:hypothetical protein L1049_025412 [Liquidambar formosana]|uniref:Uncharacterized protein n=1 Tax=Liquidambar formosana TaxID=63359 RepID=A0AAP0NF13_LIQFO